jgi:hypothetical protein
MRGPRAGEARAASRDRRLGQDTQDLQDTQDGALKALRACELPVRWQRFAPITRHVLGVLVVLVVLAARLPMKSLAGGPSTGKRHPCGRSATGLS